MWFLAPDVNYTIRPDKVEVGLYIEQRGSEGVMCLVLIGRTVVFVWMAEPAEFPPLLISKVTQGHTWGEIERSRERKERETWNRTKWQMEQMEKQVRGRKMAMLLSEDVCRCLISSIILYHTKVWWVGKSLLQTSVVMYIGYSVMVKLCKNNDSSFGVHSRVILVLDI